MTVGIALGLLNGMLSAVVFVYLVKGLAESAGGLSDIQIALKVLAIPTFWFGGPWVATRTLEAVDWEKQIEPYAVSLFLAFLLITILPMYVYIKRIASDMEA